MVSVSSLTDLLRGRFAELQPDGPAEDLNEGPQPRLKREDILHPMHGMNNGRGAGEGERECVVS